MRKKLLFRYNITKSWDNFRIIERDMRKFNLLKLDAIIQGTFQNLVNYYFVATLRQIRQLEFP